MYKQIKYFSGLNALRFFAAFFVIFDHGEQIRRKNSLFNFKDWTMAQDGHLAVVFFFVLSGFLITYLLLREKAETKTVKVKNFYLRRVLRIWPLYFLLVTIGCFVVPWFINLIHYNYIYPYKGEDVILYFVFFMPFMVNIFFGHHLLEPLWSIGVEELFYLLWAPVMKFFKNFINLAGTIITLKIALILFNNLYLHNETLKELLSMLALEAMAIGGLGAYFVYNSKKSINEYKIFSRPFQVIFIILILVKIFFYNNLCDFPIYSLFFTTPIVSNLVMDLLFCWLIIGISLRDDFILKFGSKNFGLPWRYILRRLYVSQFSNQFQYFIFKKIYFRFRPIFGLGGLLYCSWRSNNFNCLYLKKIL